MTLDYDDTIALLGAIRTQELALKHLIDEYGTNESLEKSVADLAKVKDKIADRPKNQ